MSDDLSGFSLFELFQSEAALHGQTLGDGLLALERNPSDTTQLEQLMRAAHSIKGAARILDLDPVVELAHALEDLFVAAQHGRQVVTPASVDRLLTAVDRFRQLADLPEPKLDAWLSENDAGCRALAATIRQFLAPAASPTASAARPESHDARGQRGQSPGELADGADDTAIETPNRRAAADTDRPRQPSPEKVAPADRAAPATRAEPAVGTKPGMPQPEALQPVAVDAALLQHVMRLAGESMVLSRRLQGMTGTLDTARESMRQAAEIVNRHEATCRQQWGDAEVDAFRRLSQRSTQLLRDHVTRVDQTLWHAEHTATALFQSVLATRMRPFREGTAALRRLVRDTARRLQKKVVLEIEGGATLVDRDILRALEAPLTHLMRNSVDHGIESPDQRRAGGKPDVGTILVAARHHAGMLTITIRDDGRGIDVAKLRQRIVACALETPETAAQLADDEVLAFLFLPGFSTAETVTEVSGRGVGLDVVRAMVHEVGETVRVATQPGQGTTVTLRLPVSLSVIRAALVEIAGQPFAFPLTRIDRIMRVPGTDHATIQGQPHVTVAGQSVGLVAAAQLLGLPAPSERKSDSAAMPLSVVIVPMGKQQCGMVVDGFLGEQDLVVRPLDPRLGHVPGVLAAAMDDRGRPLLIVDVEDLVLAVGHPVKHAAQPPQERSAGTAARSARRILIVEDSLTVRELERQLLESLGYAVEVAVDGKDGWNQLVMGQYDLLITDIDMPRMNGIELIRAVRADARLAKLPIIVISYKERDEDRALGRQAGANAYLSKSSFHDNSLVETVAAMLGEVD